MDPQVRGVSHACQVVSSEDKAAELFEGVFGLTRNPMHSHVFDVTSRFEIHACAEPIGPFVRTGWPPGTPPWLPDVTVPRSAIGIAVGGGTVAMEDAAISNVALKLADGQGASKSAESVAAIRDFDDQLWLSTERITRFIYVADRERASEFYEMFFGIGPITYEINRYSVSEDFDLHILDAVIPNDFQNTSLYQQLSHFCVAVADPNMTTQLALEAGLQPFQMDSDGNRRDITSSFDKLDFGYGSIYLYDPDGNLWEFELYV